MAKTKKELNQRYYAKHKEQHLEKMKDYYKNVSVNNRIECEICNCSVHKTRINTHLLTKKHTNNLELCGQSIV